MGRTHFLGYPLGLGNEPPFDILDRRLKNILRCFVYFFMVVALQNSVGPVLNGMLGSSLPQLLGNHCPSHAKPLHCFHQGQVFSQSPFASIHPGVEMIGPLLSALRSSPDELEARLLEELKAYFAPSNIGSRSEYPEIYPTIALSSSFSCSVQGSCLVLEVAVSWSALRLKRRKM
jgi:hypothetical protein